MQRSIKLAYINGVSMGFQKGNQLGLLAKHPIGTIYKGEKHWNWKGGITLQNEVIRNSIKMKIWRKAIFERDNYRCVGCGEKGIFLEAHHIYSFAQYPRLRFQVENGTTLCIQCHAIEDKNRMRFIRKIYIHA